MGAMHSDGVVAAIDHSSEARSTGRAAAREASRRGLDLHLVHVDAPLRGGLRSHDRRIEAMAATRRRAAEELLGDVQVHVGDLLPATSISSDVCAGDAGEVLVELSTTARLLVLDGRPEDGLAGLRPRSTTAAVVAHAHCPVLVLPDRLAATQGTTRSVVVGVAGDPGDGEVLGVAYEEAAARATDLVAVHAWVDPVLEPTWQTIGPLIDWESVRDEEQRLLAEALAGWPEKWPDVEVRPLLVRDQRVRALLGAATAADLLVTGHRHRRLAALGSTTRGVLHRAGCPVLVVPLPGRTEVR